MVENILCNTCGTEILATDKHCSKYSARQLELIHIEKKQVMNV
ncbi:hypothetical protein SDC9_104344 [bioreactor metagenome]|uniref:Uncharacterized protein n=1 Tax=bioreactor metagenome TaxID=1076179 RepID=A0A645AW97_9ZZZZ